MKVIYSPEYAGTVYVNAANDSKVMMDTTVVNTIGLINMLELRLGLHYEDEPEHKRVALYYDAMSQYMRKNPKNVLADSFNNAGLSTAKAVLAWRDELRMTGWDFDGEDISDRLKVIIGIEESFRKESGCDFAGRLHIVTDQLVFQKLDCKGLTVFIPCELDLLRPAEQELINVLEQQGATTELLDTVVNSNDNLSMIRRLISEGKKKQEIELDENDESFLIYIFPDERAAHEYLSFSDLENTDVWVNGDNKQMDNWLMLMGKPRTGSMMEDCSPQLTQLFIMGIGLYSTPLNVNTLIEWLNMPIHPLGKFFREKLANTIVAEGGYRNDNCKEIVRHFVEGDYVMLTDEQKQLPIEEQEIIRKSDRKKRVKLVEVYLPSFESSKTIAVEPLKVFSAELSGWARQRAHLMAEEGKNLLWAEQLLATSSMAEAFHILLGTIKATETDYKTIDSWVSTIYTKATYINTIPEIGCRTVVDSPSNIVSQADKIIWMGFEGGHEHSLECSFLYPSEKEKLTEKHYMRAWDNEKESRYHEIMAMTPLLRAKKQLILIVCERRNGEATQKHPLIVRLKKQVKNLDAIIKTPKINPKNLKDAELVENGGIAAELKFEHADLLQWPDHVSATTIGNLVEYPFDFLMENLLEVKEDAKAKMSKVSTTMGNVAHKVIEQLFAPRNGSRYSKPDEINTRISEEFESTYNNVIEAKGAILQLPENKLSEKLLHEQLKRCLSTLLEILKDNGLKVLFCEQFAEDYVGFGLPESKDENGNIKHRDLLGYIDMTLEDDKGKPVVIDFKWTSSRDYYQGLLERNRSIQLEIYRYLMMRKSKDVIERVGYFLMPEARLYSKEKFVGKHCTQLLPANDDNIVEELKNSIKYRKSQLESGIVETNGAYDQLSYVKDTESLTLYPLEKDEEKGIKKENRFTNYGILNN